MKSRVKSTKKYAIQYILIAYLYWTDLKLKLTKKKRSIRYKETSIDRKEILNEYIILNEKKEIFTAVEVEQQFSFFR